MFNTVLCLACAGPSSPFEFRTIVQDLATSCRVIEPIAVVIRKIMMSITRCSLLHRQLQSHRSFALLLFGPWVRVHLHWWRRKNKLCYPPCSWILHCKQRTRFHARRSRFLKWSLIVTQIQVKNHFAIEISDWQGVPVTYKLRLVLLVICK